MVDTTAHGYPYVEDDDPMIDYPAASQALAAVLETRGERVKAGIANVAVNSLNTNYSETVFFDQAYPTGSDVAVVPVIVTGGPESADVSISAISEDSFTVVVRRMSPAAAPNTTAVLWIAASV